MLLFSTLHLLGAAADSLYCVLFIPLKCTVRSGDKRQPGGLALRAPVHSVLIEAKKGGSEGLSAHRAPSERTRFPLKCPPLPELLPHRHIRNAPLMETRQPPTCTPPERGPWRRPSPLCVSMTSCCTWDGSPLTHCPSVCLTRRLSDCISIVLLPMQVSDQYARCF